jgi:hypothetical protein
MRVGNKINKMRRKFYLFIILICLFFGYYFYKYQELCITKVVPYCNLRFRYGYIFCNVEHNDTVETIVIESGHLHNSLNCLFLKFMPNFMVWMSYKIENNVPISLNDKEYQEIRDRIVKKEYIQRYQDINICDTSIIDKDGHFKLVPLGEYNAIIYNFLKRGYDCGRSEESGFIYISPKCNKDNL